MFPPSSGSKNKQVAASGDYLRTAQLYVSKDRTLYNHCYENFQVVHGWKLLFESSLRNVIRSG
jgi:hypothetical protein